MSSSTRQMNFKDITLSEISQSQNDNYCKNPLNLTDLEFRAAERGVVDTEARGREEFFFGISRQGFSL